MVLTCPNCGNAPQVCSCAIHLDNPNMWIVVRRGIKDITSKGVIIRVGLSEDQAKLSASLYSDNHMGYNYWAMPETSYHKPFSA